MLLKTTVVDRVAGFERRNQPQDKLVSFYEDPPNEEITLDDFELYALDRLQLLRGIESLKSRGFDENEYKEKLRALEAKLMPLKSTTSDPLERTEHQRKDQISHFILRLAYCRSEDLRNWFLKHECLLLKHRVDVMNENERAAFMAKKGVAYEQLSTEEKEERREYLIGLADVKDLAAFHSTTFYLVPFKEALSLVSTRQVYLERGHAFVPAKRLVSTIVTRFRTQLSQSLVAASHMFQHISDPRIGPLLKNMNKQYDGKDFSKGVSGVDKLTADVVDDAAANNMPLCMKNLQDNLKRDHKLKHWGRLQYGLFLKGAGMEMDDAIAFWEGHFTRLLSRENFNKQYAYSFRHMYGKEGARKNYTPYSCMKIIMGTPPEPGAFHGCPYRHSNDQQLISQLNGLKLAGSDVQEIFKLAKSSNYQLACQKHFDVTHPDHMKMDLGEGGGGAVSNHPNLWYQTSVRYHRARAGKITTSSGVAARQSESSSEKEAHHIESEENMMDVDEI